MKGALLALLAMTMLMFQGCISLTYSRTERTQRVEKKEFGLIGFTLDNGDIPGLIPLWHSTKPLSNEGD